MDHSLIKRQITSNESSYHSTDKTNVSTISSESNTNKSPQSRLIRSATVDLTPRRNVNIEDGKLKLNQDNDGNVIEFLSNVIRTSKYTVYNFVPLNLFEQMTRPANFYFLCIAVLQSIPDISISQGRPTILLPLLFVLTVSAIKDAFEDSKRHRSDRRENERLYSVLNIETKKFEKRQSQNLEVGDFVKVLDDEIYPADILMLFASSKGGYSYVETANLDGETNLKIKMVPECCRYIRTIDHLLSFCAKINCDGPNGKLDAFGGNIIVENGRDYQIVLDNLLLRGSKLRNTGHIYGIVLYTGEETKIRQNSSAKARSIIKRSSVERQMNQFILYMFSLQCFICFLLGVGAGVWDSDHRNHEYLVLSDNQSSVVGILRFFTWFIVFSAFVPISLLVSMEMVKFFQGQFMGWDIKMAYWVNEIQEWQFARAQTSGLNEELGQIQFILSDKTGTLTCNSMDFRKCIIGNKQYGSGETDITRAQRERDRMAGIEVIEEEIEELAETAAHVNFTHRKQLQHALYENMKKFGSKVTPNLFKSNVETKSNDDLPTDVIRHHNYLNFEEEFLLSLALGNTVFPTSNGDVIELKASSPDEEALVEFARFCGYELYKRDPPYIHIRISIPNQQPTIVKYEQLALLDFTSKRKRMSVIVRAPNGKIKIFSKGADNVISNLLVSPNKHEHYSYTMKSLVNFGEAGLRTLLVASAEQDESWWSDPKTGWETKYRKVMKQCIVEGPNEIGHFKGGCTDSCRRCQIENDIEIASNMELVGATAIEDKLQDKVPYTIRGFLEAGINVWVLTGDKLETAINIGMACNLLESSMERKGTLLRLEGYTVDEVENEIHEALKLIASHREKGNSGPFGLVVTSRALSRVMKAKAKLIDKFWEVAVSCKSVVGCRMQPNQKARVVNLVKELAGPNVSTLAVGDGANDEQMIRVAHVGVGIRGVEGTTAVRAADYAISQFQYLRRLLFVHGRLSYRRISTLICYMFYKNAIIGLSTLWFGFFSGFSGQPIFMEWAYQLYNVAFTAIPILVFAVLDRDVSFEELEKFPAYYALTSNGQLFNPRIFWEWIGFSVLHSFLVFAYPFASFYSASNSSDGRSDGLWSAGIISYSCIIFVTNFKLAMLFKSWTWVHHFAVWGTIIVYWLSMIILNLSPVFATAGGDYTWVLFRLFSLPKFWFTMIITVITTLSFDYILLAWHELNPVRKQEKLLLHQDSRPKVLPTPTALRGPFSPRHNIPQHTGFDFSHTAGQGLRLGFKY